MNSLKTFSPTDRELKMQLKGDILTIYCSHRETLGAIRLAFQIGTRGADGIVSNVDAKGYQTSLKEVKPKALQVTQVSPPPSAEPRTRLATKLTTPRLRAVVPESFEAFLDA